MATRKKRRLPKRNPVTKIPGRAPSDDKNYDKLRLWQGRIARAKRLREDWEKKFHVEKCANFYLGQQREGSDTSSIVLNRFLATIKTQKPNLFLHNPKMFIRPKPGKESPPEERTAAVGEGILESIGTQDDNLENSGNLAILQNFWRMGVLKVVYDPKMENNPKAGEPIYALSATGTRLKDPATLKPMLNPETGEPMIDPATNQPIIDPASGEPMIMKDSSGQPLKEPAKVVTDELYRYVWVDAKNMLLPDEGPDEQRWPWIGEKITVSLDEAKEDQRFSHRDELQANESVESKNITGGYRDDPDSKDLKKFCYYELYDKKEKRLLILADGQKFLDFLSDDDLPPGIEEDPYSLLRVDLITDPEPCPWPMPLTYPWLDPQKEYNIRRNQIMEGAKRSARKGWYTEGAFDETDEALKLLKSPIDMEFAKVTGKENESFGIFTAPDLNPSIWKDVPLLDADWFMVTGQTGPRLSQEGAELATELIFLERAANLRDADLQKAVIKWLSIAGKKMLQLVKETLTLETWIKMRGFTDKEFQLFAEAEYGLSAVLLNFYPSLRELFKDRFARELWQSISRSDLQFEAEVSVVPGSMRPRNLEMERREWMSFLQILGQFPQLALSRELLKLTAEKFEGIPERMIDELHLLAKQMVEVNARQAGRTQGGVGAGGGNGLGDMGALVNAANATGGMG